VTEQLQQDDIAAVERRGVRIDVDKLSRQVRLRNRDRLTLLEAVSLGLCWGARRDRRSQWCRQDDAAGGRGGHRSG
jgi:hypothetical protein